MKVGRPLKEIDGEDVRKFASKGCTWREIGAYFGCDESTVRKRFPAEFEQGKANGKMALRYLQWKRAVAGSDTMLIHLGKHELGQIDKVEAVDSDDLIDELRRESEARKQGMGQKPVDPECE